MRIGISLSGEGRGHATRIAVLARGLEKHHELTFWAPKEIHVFFKKIYPQAKLRESPKVGIARKNNKIKLLKTGMDAIKILFDKSYVKKLRNELNILQIAAVIVDYDPILSKAAHKEHIPIIWFGHQGIINRQSGKSFSALIAKLANKFMMPYYDAHIISSWYNGDVGALIREELIHTKNTNQNYVFVYAKPNVLKLVKKSLKHINHNFRFFPSTKYNDIKSLANCKAVISSAGHQLTAECLALSKPILMIPEEGQYEQWLNAKAMYTIGLGKISSLKTLATDAPEFLERLDEYVIKNQSEYQLKKGDDTEKAIKKINKMLDLLVIKPQ